jgi:hypothetical protein
MNIRIHKSLGLAAGLLLTALVYQPAAISARNLLEAGNGTVWKYLDGGAQPAAEWNQPDFDDSRWKSGKAPLGFGEPHLGTQVRAEGQAGRQAITTWFRCRFDAPQLDPGERLVVLCCVDDGASIYLNGQEIGRENMPKGPLSANTLALKVIGNSEEGFYSRLRVPSKAVRWGQKNVLAVEVHQGGARSSDLYFDLAVKTLPADAPTAEVAADAAQVVNIFNKRHYLGPGVTIPDGYIDGGRRMAVDGQGRATSGREILLVNRSRDVELAADLAFARSAELRALPPLERAQRLAARIDRETTPPGGLRWVGETTEQLEKEFTNKPVLIGDWVDQCQAGVCRHRSLLFKILADEAGLKAALVRGNFASRGPRGFPHAWNELLLDDGRRVLVDVMHNGGQPKFPELTDAKVIQRYLKVDNTPWYGPAAN